MSNKKCSAATYADRGHRYINTLRCEIKWHTAPQVFDHYVDSKNRAEEFVCALRIDAK